MVFKYAWRHVANVMTKSVVTLRVDDTVQKAAKLMVEHNVGSVIVVEGKGHKKKLIGLVTEHDVLKVLAKHQDSAKVKLKDVMKKDPVTVHPQEDFMVASVIMERYQVKKLPVVESDEVVGMVTTTDLAHSLASSLGDVIQTFE